MTFVDTSVWIAYFRGEARTVERLDALLDADEVALAAPVRVEILSGAGKANFARLKQVLDGLPAFYPTDATWTTIEAWIEQAGAAGERFGAADLLIGAIAAEQAGAIWSLDTDFERLARLGLIQLSL